MPEFGQMGVDWEERIDFGRMRRERLQRAQNALQKSDLNAMFIFRLEDVRYLTSLRSHLGPVALLGLAAAGDKASAASRRGVRYLLDTQQSGGTWKEDLATGTGFPNVFFLSYHLYRQYFPLLALASYRA